jgi:polysaccharide chain length determinant protein (PEP-CTERM system associated)
MISIHEQINVIYGYLHGLWRYRWSALFISWLIAIGGWIYVYSLPDVYASKAAIHIDTTSVMQPLLEGLMVHTDPEEEINVMTRILLSRENLLNVIRETDMHIGVNSPEAREGLVRQLADTIKIDKLGGQRNRANIYEISYESNSAEEAFKVVFNLLNTLIENTLNSSRLDTVMAEEFLNEQIRDYEQRLILGEERLAAFKKKNIGFMPDERGGYYARLSSQQGLIDSTKSKLRLAKQRYREISAQLLGEKPVLSTSSYTSASALKLRNLRTQLDDLLVQFTEEHPDVRAMRARIADMEENAQSPAGSSFADDSDNNELNPVYQDLKQQESKARVEVGTLQVQLAEQKQQLSELQESIDVIPRVEADLAKLNRDYDITKQRYLALVERRESARMAQKVEQNNSELIFRVVDAPVVPLLPSGPNRPVFLMLVFLAALGAGLAWSVFRFLLYPTFVDFKQMQKMLDLPILGTISLQVSPEKRQQRRIDMTIYLLVIMLMVGSFAAAVLYQQQGSVFIRLLMSELGI